ncbi:MAG: chemotaxis protein CheB, partial [Pseudomonadota bacterium]
MAIPALSYRNLFHIPDRAPPGYTSYGATFEDSFMNMPELEEVVGPGSEPALDFPVVAVGASAGGLDAFRTLLSQLKPDMQQAYVLVQHLDPTHESL